MGPAFLSKNIFYRTTIIFFFIGICSSSLLLTSGVNKPKTEDSPILKNTISLQHHLKEEEST